MAFGMVYRRPRWVKGVNVTLPKQRAQQGVGRVDSVVKKAYCRSVWARRGDPRCEVVDKRSLVPRGKLKELGWDFLRPTKLRKAIEYWYEYACPLLGRPVGQEDQTLRESNCVLAEPQLGASNSGHKGRKSLVGVLRWSYTNPHLPPDTLNFRCREELVIISSEGTEDWKSDAAHPCDKVFILGST
jgi:hypothetical protein